MARVVTQNTQLAHSLGVNTPVVNAVIDNIVVLMYASGNQVSRLESSQISEVSHMMQRMNVPLMHLEPVMVQMLNKLITDSVIILRREDLEPDTLIDILKASFPSRIYPVFDHLDIGIHNLLIDGNSICLIDEESFGIVPFGYSIYRATSNDYPYVIALDEEQEVLFLRKFPKKQRDYFETTRVFWSRLYSLRSAARSILKGKPERAQSLLDGSLKK